MNITIPGVAYEECFDPHASDMEADLELPTPTFKRVGRGSQVTYAGITVEQAREVARHLIDMGGLWLANSDPEYDRHERARYRKLVETGNRLLAETHGT